MTDPAVPQTVAELLARRSDDESIGLLAGDERWTWSEIGAESERYAAALAALRRDGPFHVGVLAGNTPEFLFTMFGAALGVPVTLVVPGNASRERLERIRAHGAELILTDPIEGYDFALREAQRLAAASLTRDPGQPRMRFALARLLLAHQRIPEAIAQLERSLQLDPTQNFVREALIDLLERVGREQDARQLQQELGR